MTCKNGRARIQEYLDRQLSALETVAFERHLSECPSCQQYCSEVAWVRQALRLEAGLTPAGADHLWGRVQARRPRPLRVTLSERWESFCAFWRDLEPALLWSKVAALPVACGFFVLIMLQFSPLWIQEVTYPVLTLFRPPSSVFEQLTVTSVAVRQEGAQIDGLMSTVWKMPYEDSLSLVAEITPEGHAQIDNILEYPKSLQLLEAVDLALRGTQFEAAPTLPNPFVIYSFQKIDVYGGQRGL